MQDQLSTRKETRLNIRCTPELLARIDRAAKSLGVTRTALVKVALAEYLTRAQARRKERNNKMTLNWTDQDIASGSFHADLGEFGTFEAYLDAPVSLVDYGRRLEVHGLRRYVPDGEDEAVEEEITLHVDLADPVDPDEAAGMTAGEVFSRAWENFTF